MEDKTKLYVFAKKEVFLIFVFMILISITSFLLGVKIGVNNSYENSGYAKEDIEKVEILSPDEEKVDSLDKSSLGTDEDTYKALKEKTDMALEKKVDQEFSGNTQSKESVEVEAVSPESTAVEAPSSAKDKLSGKYTIQVGSFPSVNEAEVFAKGFKARGYTTIINEKDLEHKGTWFRVSIGVFDNISEAKDYVIEHKSLFSSSEYRFSQFD